MVGMDTIRRNCTQYDHSLFSNVCASRVAYQVVKPDEICQGEDLNAQRQRQTLVKYT